MEAVISEFAVLFLLYTPVSRIVLNLFRVVSRSRNAWRHSSLPPLNGITVRSGRKATMRHVCTHANSTRRNEIRRRKAKQPLPSRKRRRSKSSSTSIPPREFPVTDSYGESTRSNGGCASSVRKGLETLFVWPTFSKWFCQDTSMKTNDAFRRFHSVFLAEWELAIFQ